MSLSWLLFFAATIALVVPLPMAYRSTHRYRSLQELDIERRNQSWWPSWRMVLRFPGHWLEFTRGLLAGFGVRLTLDEVGNRFPAYQPYAELGHHVVPLLFALVGVMVISLAFRQPNRAIAPIPFVAATLLALLPPQVSVLALVFAGASAITMCSLGAFFAILAPSLALLGYLLDRQLWPSVVGAIFAATPLLVAFSQGHEFVVAVRRPRSAT